MLTFSNGDKEKITIIPKKEPIFFSQLEKELVGNINKMLVNTNKRVIKCHLMRN